MLWRIFSFFCFIVSIKLMMLQYICIPSSIRNPLPFFPCFYRSEGLFLPCYCCNEPQNRTGKEDEGFSVFLRWYRHRYTLHSACPYRNDTVLFHGHGKRFLNCNCSAIMFIILFLNTFYTTNRQHTTKTD